jgi:inhibitor of cysteine peptidase
MPFRLIFAICGVFGILLAVFFVSSKDVSMDVSCGDFREQGGNVTEEAEIGAWSDLLMVSLCSNPTTGFKWELTEVTDEDVIVYDDNEYVSLEAGGVEGASGTEVWTFKVLKAGSSNITMEYSRSWEGGEEAEWTFILTADVK